MSARERAIHTAQVVHYIASAKRAQKANLLIAVDRYISTAREIIATQKVDKPDELKRQLDELENTENSAEVSPSGA